MRQDLHLLRRYKQPQPPAASELGPELVSFYKQTVQKQHKKIGSVADAWEKLVPPTLSQHCALEGFHRGTLTVLVDSSSHLYELKQLLLAGLQKQLLVACQSTGLKKITLKQGRWYEGDTAADKKVKF